MFNFGSRIALLFLLAFPCGLISIASLCIVVVAADSTDVKFNSTKCEEFKGYSDCASKLWERMDREQWDFVTDVCRQWYDFTTCDLTVLSECLKGTSSMRKSLLEDPDMRQYRPIASRLCSRSSSACPRASPAILLPLPLLAGLIVSGATYT